MFRTLAASLTLLLVLAPALEAKRRAVRPISDPSTPAGWLYANAHALHGTELTPVTSDLEPLRTIAGDAPVVGLGDGTHGTHEFSAIKLRMIDFLVRELDFDAVAFEAPFPVMNRINAYVQGGPGDPRAILGDAANRLAYWFWYTGEMLEVIEWMRAYNATRGSQPAIEIVGVDAYDDVTAAADVVEYLRSVDHAAAAAAESDYACVRAGENGQACQTSVDRVRAGLESREAQYIAASSPRAYHDALRNAQVLFQDFDRDRLMAQGTLWARAHRGTSGKVIYWAHNEHVSKTPDSNFIPAGVLLQDELGDGYVTVGTMTASGSFRGWKHNRETGTWDRVTTHFGPVANGTYVSYFRQRGDAAALLIPLQGDLPQWLSAPSSYIYGGSSGVMLERKFTLAETYDAIVYFERTRPVDDE